MAKSSFDVYPVGTPGVPWGEKEKKEWLDRQSKKRDYFVEVVSKLSRFDHVDTFQYGELDYRKYNSAKFPLYGLKTKSWDSNKPMVLVTGGVHGYETSGVQGALLFAEKHINEFSGQVNVLVLPCLSPWGYECIQRWNPLAIDPNRQFNPENPGCEEAGLAMKCAQEYVAKSNGILVHTDLHETTDTDNSEFRPSKIARDGKEEDWSAIPDGFYLVCNTHNSQPEWEQEIIQDVEKITHIAPAEEDGTLIGEKMSGKGVITIPGRKWGVCGSHTDARFSTTTEVYPDSSRATPEQCNRAQSQVVQTAVRVALKMT